MKRRAPSRKRSAKQRLQTLASQRIEVLWKEARREAISRPELARMHVGSAKRIAQKARVKLPRQMVRQICRGCGGVLVPGENARVRLRSNRARHVAITCLGCGHITRFYSDRQ